MSEKLDLIHFANVLATVENMCPSQYGLDEIYPGECAPGKCLECWLAAIRGALEGGGE